MSDRIIDIISMGGEEKFKLGRLVATPNAIAALDRNGDQSIEDVHARHIALAAQLLTRHVSGDWGDADADDKRANDAAVEYDNCKAGQCERHGVIHLVDPARAARVLSAYTLADGSKVWIITEWDRSVTTILLPEDY